MRDAGCQPGISSQTFPGRYDLTALHALNPQRYPYLLASTAKAMEAKTADSNDSQSRARYDILLAFPQASLILSQSGKLLAEGLTCTGDDFLQALDSCWQAARPTQDSHSTLPFHGGWFLYLGYELVQQIEPVLQLHVDQQSALPVACATRIPAAVIVDHIRNETHLLVESGFQPELKTMATDLKAITDTAQHVELDYEIGLQEEAPDAYLHSVEQVKRYIVDGDVFQVNLSRMWQGLKPPGVNAIDLFRQLSQNNPAPFAGLARFAESAIISSSPERLVKTRGQHIDTRPIAGTRPRGSIPADDQAALAELIAHPKERAEHIMLIDLERNDLGRVCRPGTIRVNELMALESYAHVHHIVSNVEGELRESVTPGEVIRAVFPGGTITGCPKVRCMEIIAELEQGARGAYTGSMGYLNHNGDMDLNILIRSIVLDAGQVKFRAGAGLVADSDPQHELDETRAKAKGMLLAMSCQNPPNQNQSNQNRLNGNQASDYETAGG